MKIGASKPMNEAEWRARDDLHTLIEANKIRKDKKRLAAAKRYAKTRVKEQQEDINATKALIG